MIHNHNNHQEENCHPQENGHCHECSCCGNHEHNEEQESNWRGPVLSMILLLSGIILDAAGVQWFQNSWLRLAFYALAWLHTGLGVLREAFEAMRDGEIFSEFLLMSIASIGAFAIGEYPEAVAVMTFYCIGELLQDRAVGHARENIKSLIAIRPEHAVIVQDGKRMTVSPADVAVGDMIEVKPGERVPIDGILTNDAASFDTAALTGESMPRTIEKGHEVLAGMIVRETKVLLQATRPMDKSAISRILHLVEDASNRKAPAELFIRRFARIYTPVVVCLAVLVVLLPWLYSLMGTAFEYHFNEWLHRALIFLVISCPCALVISIPLSYYAGIGAGSRRGILFKGSNYLDAIAQVDTVVFDKTGTLTTGRFAVTQVEGLSENQMACVAAIEQQSTHPIARAILDYCQESSATPSSISIKEIAGHGLSATVADSHWLVGTTRLLEREGIAVPTHLQNVSGTIVAVAIDGSYAGYILLKDSPKKDARDAIASLERQGIDSVMLSGDKQSIVDEMAHETGIKQAHGDLLPEDKVEHIKQLQNQSGKEKEVAFVGDGINDAPVLAMSDVGIAMGALGSDMAIETADIVIQTDQPSRVADAVTLGRRTQRIVKQNITFAIGIKVLVMILGVMGVANLWEAVFADVGVALLCVLNSLRLMKTTFRS